MAAGLPWLDDPIGLSSSSLQTQAQRNGRNVFDLLAQREISPRTKYSARRKWGETSKVDVESYFEPKIDRVRDARRELLSWVEAESLRHLTAKYCPLVPSPRSTIAAAFSPDGKTLASTHGDHTVKLIDYETGRCLRVLSGHRRTPWVVRFHPVHLEILASGSLDNEVRLWNTNTSECIGSRDFYCPIASIAFHAGGELLAIASGHKLYLWNYNINGEHSSPTVVLRTTRSLRAVNFHQHAAPLLLTAEVNDLDSSDSSVARATSLGALHYPPPSVFLANVGLSDSLSLAAELPLMYPPLSYVPVEFRQNEVLSSINPTSWEFPFLQGWLMGQRQAGIPSTLPPSGGQQDYSNSGGGGIPVPMINRIQSDLAASMAATEAAELPCTVKLRIWSHNLKSPCAPLNAERCLLIVPHAVLCSEMGAHFSPCGRFLAACVACVLPESEADPGLLNQFHQDVTGAATSPTRHPIAARQVMYELRIYSLEERTFGSVLISRAIRAAHCLTSIQFSPTSEHILLAYGRRHSSLLKSIVVNGETSLPIYTVLEVYRVSNMELVSILPSAEDEVNVACFHPSAGGGLAYGTKEGKLRFLQYDGAHDLDHTSPNILSQEDMVQVQAYALEG